jgi:gamma-glutamyltranspeptidase/glutathione hydrolase
MLSEKFGKAPFERLFDAAIRYGREGFLVSPTIASQWAKQVPELKEVVALAKKGKIKATPVTLRAPAEVSRTLEELKAGKILGRVVLDMEKEAA